MWWCEFHSSHLINVARLPCESKNAKNVMLQWDITKENCIRCIVASSNLMDQGHVPYVYLLAGDIQQCVLEKIFMTSTTCKNVWCKFGLTLNRALSMLRLTSGAIVWGRVRAGGGHFEHSFVVNIKTWIRDYMCFRCCGFHQAVWQHH